VIRRFCVHNFRCLGNFELPIAGLSSVLRIGNNGSGKTTVRLALEILQRMARGTNRVGDLVKAKHSRTSAPGKFVYSPPAGTVPAVGVNTLSVTFTPNNPADYNSATASVQITVN
jgi:recombinational DNA repair ATPase RecF